MSNILTTDVAEGTQLRLQVNGQAHPTEVAVAVGSGAFVNATSFAVELMLFGDGSDGALIANAGTTTLTQNKDYSTILLTGTARLDTNGYRVRCNGLVDLSGMPADTIFRSVVAGGPGNPTGAGGTSGTATIVAQETLSDNAINGSAGGTGLAANGLPAAAVTPRSYASGGQSGASGAGGAGTGGAGGVGRGATIVTRGGASFQNAPMVNQFPQSGTLTANASGEAMLGGASGAGGGGGGGNGADAGGGGGGGGAGAAGIWLAFRQLRCAGASPAVISARGGAGGNGANAQDLVSLGGGGGGAGGGGGWVNLTIGELLDAGAADAVAVDGGNGGAGGNGTNPAGAGGDGGGGGAGGYALVINLTAQTVVHNLGTVGNAGGAAVGTAGGAAGPGQQTRVSIA